LNTTAPATSHNEVAPFLCLDSSGSGTAQSCTTSPPFTPAAGDQIIYKTTTTNTGDVTTNVNSSSAAHFRKWQSAALAAGDLVAGVYVLATYDGTYWQVGGNIGNAPSGGTSAIASGALPLATSSIASGTCQAVSAGSVNSATATGVAATDAIQFAPNGSIKAVTGYTPSTSGGLTITAYPTSGYVNFDVCNWTSGALVPGAVTLNWRVTR
jgi:hypothetical protein